MSDKTKSEELNESELGDVTGGAAKGLSGLEIEGIKPRLTTAKGVRPSDNHLGNGIRANTVGENKLRPSGVKGRIKGIKGRI